LGIFTQIIPQCLSSDEDELAAQVAGFLVQFLEVFSELRNKNFYVAGESYGK